MTWHAITAWHACISPAHSLSNVLSEQQCGTKKGYKQTVEDPRTAGYCLGMDQSITALCKTLALACGALLVNLSSLTRTWGKTSPLGLASTAQQAHQLRLGAWVQPLAQGCLALR